MMMMKMTKVVMKRCYFQKKKATQIVFNRILNPRLAIMLKIILIILALKHFQGHNLQCKSNKFTKNKKMKRTEN